MFQAQDLCLDEAHNQMKKKRYIIKGKTLSTTFPAGSNAHSETVLRNLSVVSALQLA